MFEQFTDKQRFELWAITSVILFAVFYRWPGRRVSFLHSFIHISFNSFSTVVSLTISQPLGLTPMCCRSSKLSRLYLTLET